MALTEEKQASSTHIVSEVKQHALADVREAKNARSNGEKYEPTTDLGRMVYAASDTEAATEEAIATINRGEQLALETLQEETWRNRDLEEKQIRDLVANFLQYPPEFSRTELPATNYTEQMTRLAGWSR